MSDYAHRKTDALLSELEGKVLRIYFQAAEEVKAKLKAVLDEYMTDDVKMRDMVNKGQITKNEYIAWREEKILMAKQYGDLIPTLTQDVINADRLAVSMIGNHLPQVYALNANYGTYEIENGTNIDTSWTLYDRHTVENLIKNDPDLLPMPELDTVKDTLWNKTHINGAITQGILQGEPMDAIARRLQSVVKMDYNVAIRSARTATTAAENAGRVHSYERAEKMGIKMQMEWQSAWDNRVRHEHRMLDGQRVNIGEKFKVAGDEIAYPGDPEAPGYLIYNCRCTLVAALEGYDHDSSADFNMKGKTYEEWKHEHERQHSESIFDFDYTQIPDAIQIGTFPELEQYMGEKYGIKFSTAVATLDISNVKNACYGVEMIINEFPFMNGFIKSINVTDSIYDGESDGRNIFLSRLTFLNPAFGRSKAVAIGVHESVHCIDLFMGIERAKKLFPDFPEFYWDAYARTELVNRKIISKEIAEEAYAELLQIDKYKKYSKKKLRELVTPYAGKNSTEFICDAMAKRAIHGENVDDATKIVCKKFIERLKDYD